MKITKYVHSCLLVEEAGEHPRAALFDPGEYSPVPVDSLQRLDDIFITHQHPDHMDVALVARLQAKFPDVRIVAPADAIVLLTQGGVKGVTATPPEGAQLFEAPHADIRPFAETPPPQEIGIHYRNKVTHPGDSHDFHETMAMLALPVQAPWGSTVNAVRLALELKPKYVVPIHDWHWRDEARTGTYERLARRFAEAGITFLKLENGVPIVIDL
ncbi:MAG TPA: MBL fold metallo-hydrolase [Candidatus Saccharimonadales bacterium]|nr:MBL fold metallo-hydrolase [Candidatus Saccharimonadales bacterium]